MHKRASNLGHINEILKWFALNLGQYFARCAKPSPQIYLIHNDPDPVCIQGGATLYLSGFTSETSLCIQAVFFPSDQESDNRNEKGDYAHDGNRMQIVGQAIHEVVRCLFNDEDERQASPDAKGSASQRPPPAIAEELVITDDVVDGYQPEKPETLDNRTYDTDDDHQHTHKHLGEESLWQCVLVVFRCIAE